MYCADCESVDDYFFEQDTYFWIFVPTTETFAKLARYVGSQNYVAQQVSTHCICVQVKTCSVSNFLTGVNGVLEQAELAGTKLTTMATSLPPDIDAMSRMTTFNILINRYKAKWLINSIEHENYETWFQPIIYAHSALDTPKVYSYEGLFRMRDDTNAIVPPQLAFMLAEQADLLFSLDLVARRSAVEHFAAARLRGKLFINFNPSSIYDPSYCLRSTAAAIYELGLTPADIVFEVTETHQSSDLNHLKGILAFYRNAGFKVAMDDIGSGWSGLNLLQKIRPDYVKIDMELVRDVHHDVFKQNIVKSLVSIARTSGITTVAEGIETEDEAKWLMDNNIDLLQGYLFGRPKFYTQKVTQEALSGIKSSVSPLKEAAKRF
ncbi:EAL domain-containing protein [Alishewanella tabrizica]|uniref:Signal transduction protein n=1 Tax=Alishewanella tabrizica TaxID=671278 RepID=A0ABQ2WE21_9ALTE|nr:EAL domain-containing protein [Alishewanella tabrizica]GGW51920.1 signal transduction protein [Alishewanella tabrizica]